MFGLDISLLYLFMIAVLVNLVIYLCFVANMRLKGKQQNKALQQPKQEQVIVEYSHASEYYHDDH